MGDLAQRLTQFWWIRLPHMARRLSVQALLVLVDGLFISVWPRVATVLSPLALILGLLFGAFHPFFRVVFSESWPVLILAVLLGVFSGHLGAMFLVGFAFGDFFLFHTDWTFPGGLFQNLLRVRVPLLIEYGLLAFMTTGISLATKTLLMQLRPPQRLPRQTRVALAVVGHLGLTLLLVYLWMQVVPILIRPVFTWPGGGPSVEAMEKLQFRGWVLLVVAGLASLGRSGLLQLVNRTPDLSAALEERELQLNDGAPVVPASATIPLPASVALTSIWATLMLSGMLEAWWQGLILLIVIAGVRLARARLVVPGALMPWARQVARFPLPLRLAVGILLTTLLSRIALAPLLVRTNSFWPILFLTVLALLIFYVLDPLSGEVQPASE